MKYHNLVGGVRLPVLGLGTWGIGGKHTAETSRDEEEIAALRAGIDLGMTHIDTAEVYGAGHAEEVVGEAIKPYNRSDLFITTKVWNSHLRYDVLIESIEASLSRLDVEYVDLYLIHKPNPEVSLKETMKALEHCANEGFTRFIGVSNFTIELLEEAQSALREHQLVADQVEYSLLRQDPMKNLLPYCSKNEILLIAYSPLALGRLARPGHVVLDSVAEKYGKTQAQVSLNWLISQEQVVAIPKASMLEHLGDNLGATGWKLAKGDFEMLTKTFS